MHISFCYYALLGSQCACIASDLSIANVLTVTGHVSFRYFYVFSMFQNYYTNCISNLLPSTDQIRIDMLALGTVLPHVCTVGTI